MSDGNARRTQLLFNLFGSSWPLHRHVLSRKWIYMCLCIITHNVLSNSKKTPREPRVLWNGNRTRGRIDCTVAGESGSVDIAQEGRNRGYCIELRNKRHRTTSPEEIPPQGASILAVKYQIPSPDQDSSSAQTPHPLTTEDHSFHTCFPRKNFVWELPEVEDAACTRRESTWQPLARLRYLRLWYVWVTPAPGTKTSKSLPHLSSFHSSGVHRLQATGLAPPKYPLF